MAADIDALAERAFRTFLRHQPEVATMWGLHDLGFDAEVSDWSEAGAQRERADVEGVLEELQALDREHLALQDRITVEMLERDAHERLGFIDAATEEFAVAPFAVGPQAQILTYVPKFTLRTAQHADDYLERAGKLDRILDQARERLSTGVRAGRTPPIRAVQGAIAQIDGYLGSDLENDPLLRDAPDEHPDRDGWRAALRTVLEERFRPALQRFRDHLEQVVGPAGRPDERSGLTYLPDGDELYAFFARVHTTTERSPGDIHELGRDILERLREEYAQVGGDALGTTDQREIFDRLRNDPALRFDDRDQILSAAEAAVSRATDEAPAWFGRTPDVPCDVRAMGEFEEASAPPAYYLPPPMDRSRPGVYWVNTGEPRSRERYLTESIAYHEAIPGHHFQIALAQGLEELPRYRRMHTSTAYVEGWGLYAERLADEMGLYSTDLMRLGMLATDSWRACRLVVDTGLHHLGWGRDQAVAFMREHSPVAHEVIDVEVDRYIGMPGQALSYMVGRVELNRLRSRAEAALGDRFSLPSFHDTVLLSGALPLTTLETVVEDWLAGA